MAIFQTVSGFNQHITGGAFQKEKWINFSATYDDCRFPDEHRNALKIILSNDELNTLITELQKIANM